MFAIVDRIKGGRRKYWQMLLPADRDGSSEAAVHGRMFLIRQGEASLAGRVIAPLSAPVRLAKAGTTIDTINGKGELVVRTLTHPAIWVEGGDEFFVVMTLQKGAVPPLRAEGDGIYAVVRVGRQVVRFDGKRIVFERSVRSNGPSRPQQGRR